MSAYTRGPWSVASATPGHAEIRGGSKTIAILLHQGSDFPPKPETLANASLMAAAPELLDAVRAVLEDRHGDESTISLYLRALIAKATGRPVTDAKPGI
jgi:hypothetical protein